MDQNQQVISYIRQCRAQGIPDVTARNQLLQYGWHPTMVDAALQQLPQYQQHQSQLAVDDHRVRTGILWILSPFILLFGVVVLQFTLRAVGINSRVVNLVSVLIGISGVILVIVGPIVGIIKLSRK